MKKLIYCVAVSVFILSCTKEQQPDYVLLSGKLENSTVEKINVSGKEFKKSIPVNTDGTFSDTLYLETSGYYTFSAKERTEMYLENGYDLDITIDLKEFDESVTYAGIGAPENNYMAAKYLMIEDMKGKNAEFYAMEESDYKNKLNTMRNALDSILTAADTHSSFDVVEKDNIFYAYSMELLKYPSYHAYYAKKEDFKPGENFHNDIKDINYQDESAYRNIPSYRDLVNQKFSNDYGDNYQEYNSGSKALIKTLEPMPKGYIKDEIMNRYFGFSLTADEHMESLYAAFMADVQNEEYKAKVEERYKKLQNLVKGKPSPVFAAYENHKGGTTGLEDLKGKYVYIDVWATWCGPCKAEIPYLKQVEKDYHDRNIEFVSISIDTPNAYETWKKMVVDEELGGIQLLADNNWKSKFVTDYDINGIPRFILIDPDGNIVSSDAPRPSNEKLRVLFEELKI